MGFFGDVVGGGKKLFGLASGQSQVGIAGVPGAPTALQASPERDAARASYLANLGRQEGFAGTLQARAEGTGGPSPAEIDARNRMRDRLAYAQSLGASARGANRLSAQRNATREGYAATGALEGDLLENRAREQLNAEGTYSNFLSGLGGETQAQQQIGQDDQQALLDAEMTNRGLQVQRNVANAQLAQGKAARGSDFFQSLVKNVASAGAA